MKIKSTVNHGYHLGGVHFPAGMTVEVPEHKIEPLKIIQAFQVAVEIGNLEIKGRKKPKKTKEEE